MEVQLYVGNGVTVVMGMGIIDRNRSIPDLARFTIIDPFIVRRGGGIISIAVKGEGDIISINFKMVGFNDFVFPDHDAFFSSLPAPCKRVCRRENEYVMAEAVVDNVGSNGGGVDNGTTPSGGNTGTAELVDEEEWVMGPAGPSDTRPKPGDDDYEITGGGGASRPTDDTTATSPTIGPGLPVENESDTVAVSPTIGAGTAEERCIYQSTTNGSLDYNTACMKELDIHQDTPISIQELFPRGSIIDYKAGEDYVTVVKMPGQPVARRFTRNGIWKLLIVKEQRPSQVAVDFRPDGIEVTYVGYREEALVKKYWSNKDLDKMMRYYHWWVSDNWTVISDGSETSEADVVVGFDGVFHAHAPEAGVDAHPAKAFVGDVF